MLLTLVGHCRNGYYLKAPGVYTQPYPKNKNYAKRPPAILKGPQIVDVPKYRYRKTMIHALAKNINLFSANLHNCIVYII